MKRASISDNITVKKSALTSVWSEPLSQSRWRSKIAQDGGSHNTVKQFLNRLHQHSKCFEAFLERGINSYVLEYWTRMNAALWLRQRRLILSHMSLERDLSFMSRLLYSCMSCTKGRSNQSPDPAALWTVQNGERSKWVLLQGQDLYFITLHVFLYVKTCNLEIRWIIHEAHVYCKPKHIYNWLCCAIDSS